MVAANESSIKEMIERVKVEAGEEDCMICLEELKNRNNLHVLLASTFKRLRIDMPSATYNTVIQTIMGCGLGTANRTYEIERINNGMVAKVEMKKAA
ncbi:hypothetical protein GOBAR_AA23768 [Gossypium barbadense]|uniref:Uncharacterized protein n=1 Tax=Gossypium barbadense TaxID=3634 RepID=A0A2P5X0M8_GOSBA|nr:hypothetical protein GOBAR_AA23768 [Gossypium barbadense]